MNFLPDIFTKYSAIYCVDFEFSAPAGERPNPICVVSRELKSGALTRTVLEATSRPPFEINCESLYIAYYASAELGCHLVLGWDIPVNIVDLYAEFRCLTNGQDLFCGSGLLGALTHFGLDSIGAEEKEGMRELAIRGGPYTDVEHLALLDYCQSDVDSLRDLFLAMADSIDLPRALLRGRYMSEIAKMEYYGIPIDTDIFRKLSASWSDIKQRIVSVVDIDYGLYEGIRFRSKYFESYIRQQGIAWPRLPSGRLSLSDDSFKAMASAYPQVAPLWELRATLSKMRKNSLPVGRDGRSRCLLSPFRSKTGRNQPSNSKFPFGLPSWMRSIIKPSEGNSLAYIDWAQQEFGIAAALSGDFAMKSAYLSGDPYLAFGKQAGGIPEDATKESHKAEREQFKQCALAVQYGMGGKSLAQKLGLPKPYGDQLIELHKKTYPIYWSWLDSVVARARVDRKMKAAFGWSFQINRTTGGRTIANFPMQANGSEMLRVAIIIAAEKGVKICAPVHDAILIEALSTEIVNATNLAQLSMVEASRMVLKGFELRSDAEIIHYPDRYCDPRGRKIWNIVSSQI